MQGGNLNGMKKIFYILTFSLIYSSAFSQLSEAETARKLREEAEKAAALVKDSVGWIVNGSFSVTANSIMLQNWQAGGANVYSGASIFNITPIYNAENYSWVNNLVMAYGLNRQEGATFKMDDRIDFQSNFNYRLNSWLNISSLVSFRTQFDDGFANRFAEERISSFMAPGYLVGGIGATYKRSNRFIAYVSPATIKNTFVLDSALSAQGAYGVTPNSRNLFEFGTYVNIFYREKLNEKINFQLRLDLFSNLVGEDPKPQNIDVNAELLFFWKLSKYLSFNVALNLIYDDDILIEFERPNGTTGSGPRTQLKSVLGAGFAYTF